jgi:predicted enzyme related to lactoylglutathione lyase
MLTGTHAIIFAEDAERTRVFYRDVFEGPHVDAHDGWPIFKMPPAELGIHPAEQSGVLNSAAPSGHHDIFLMCDDIEATVKDLTLRDC